MTILRAPHGIPVSSACPLRKLPKVQIGDRTGTKKTENYSGIMNIIVAHAMAILWGMLHSFKGLYTVFLIDKALKKRRETKEQVAAYRNKFSRNPIRVVPERQKDSILRTVQKTMLMNAVLSIIVVAFCQYIAFPALVRTICDLLGLLGANRESTANFTYAFFHVLFSVVYQLPSLVVQVVFSTMFCNDISKMAFAYSGCTKAPAMQVITTVADMLFSLGVQWVFKIQLMLFSYLMPTYFPSIVLKIVLSSWLYSFAAFEYRWFEMNYPLFTRLDMVEREWPYHLGFGLPLALTTTFLDPVLFSGIYSVASPILIVSANVSNPVQSKCAPLHMFSLAVKTTNWLADRINIMIPAMFKFFRSRPRPR